ncbi:nucleoside diphosphate kinase regulator [Shewanella sp. NFH-SH190041]|uniref:nucleoside diphosphate kinase regulator n=1 Tax=Shewanella sp. NFH-SH190041 TaxID=2950245 RepID=UPI0021C355F2|nr:nucleoside diphosphate kinase regulator [Shewanella sp. NFH-SH190041]BDM63987.1 nucleoside diphosphate kinase regulator [Shewanella sp. NFH-SH190041]
MQPDIVISSQDLARLEALLETLPPDGAGTLALENELARAEVLPVQAMPDNVVTMNSTVSFRVSGSDELHTLTLVYPGDGHDGHKTVSVLAPVGSALLGVKIGDQIAWPMPNNATRQVTIEAIHYQPEREGDYHL